MILKMKRNLFSMNFIMFSLMALWGLVISGENDVAYGQEGVSISGVTEAIHDVTLAASVDGRIAKIHFYEGARVNKGQRILELDKRLEELEVERRKLIWQSKVEVESAKTRVRILKSRLEATRSLFESTRSVSREELEEKELEYELAVAEQKRLEKEEEKQRIEYEMALESLRKRNLKSPIDGVIIKLSIDVGESCEAEQPLVQVVDTSTCLLVCNVEEPLGRTLREGQAIPLKIKTGSRSIKKRGILAFVSPVVDSASGLLEVKAQFENKNGSVRPGVAGYMILKTKQ